MILMNLLLLLTFGFQNSWSPLLVYINSFHDYVMVVVIMVISLVFYFIVSIHLFSSFYRNMFGNESLELIWTFIPTLILSILAFPSLYTLYLIDESSNSFVTLKVIGHQWYWSYEYSDFDLVEFDSYMVSDIKNGSLFRLLEVDNNTILPYMLETRVITTSSDVIHSWTIPSLGVKVDSVPGRLNQLTILSSRLGLVFGQCSEICGSFHSFMPICIEFVTDNLFLSWLKTFK